MHVLLGQGIAAARSGRHERAQRCFEAVLAIDPNNEEAWLWLASMTRDPFLSRAMYRRILEVHPESARARDALRWLEQQKTQITRPAYPPEELLPAPKEPSIAAPVIESPAPSAPQPEPGEDRAEGPALFVPPWELAVALPPEPAGPAPAQPEPPPAPVPPGEVTPTMTPAAPPAAVPVAPPRVSLPSAAAAAPAPEHAYSSPGRYVRNGLMVVMLGFVLLGSFLIIALTRSEARADRLRLALGITTVTPTPTATETPTQTPTQTATPVPTLTPTSSPTLTPSLVPTPTAVPIPAWVTQRYLPLPLEEKWIEVDLTHQRLFAYEGTTVVFTATISTGRKATPTLEGKFRILRKLESQDMVGADYYLPAVPYVMYFYGGYALHGAYWHNSWGTPVSHGCINLKREDAKWLYTWSDPQVPPKARSALATKAKPGTWVLIHR